MTHTTVEAIYAIRHKESGKYIKFGSKCAWATSGAAKNAWNLHGRIYDGFAECYVRPKLDDQWEYEIVDLLDESERILSTATSCLKEEVCALEQELAYSKMQGG